MVRDSLTIEFPKHADKAIFVELLAEGGSHTVQADKSHLDLWVSTYKIPFTTLIDVPGVGMRISTTLSPRETQFLVELATMNIIMRNVGFSGLTKIYDKLATL